MATYTCVSVIVCGVLLLGVASGTNGTKEDIEDLLQRVQEARNVDGNNDSEIVGRNKRDWELPGPDDGGARATEVVTTTRNTPPFNPDGTTIPTQTNTTTKAPTKASTGASTEASTNVPTEASTKVPTEATTTSLGVIPSSRLFASVVLMYIALWCRYCF